MNKQKKNIFSISYIGFLLSAILVTILSITLHSNSDKDDFNGYTITNKTDYKSHDMYLENSNTVIEIPNSINLKEISEANDNIDTFRIDGNCTHTIFIPSDFSCWLSSKNNSKIVVGDENITDYGAIGIIVGHDIEFQGTTESNLHIFNNNISSSAEQSYGIRFFSTVSGTVEISNNIISSFSSDASNGIYFNCPLNGTVEISNNIISSFSSSNSAIGIYFDDAILALTIEISQNTISAFSTSNVVYGISFRSAISSNSNIKISQNAISIFSSATVYDIIFNDTISGTVEIINNTISASSSNSYGVYFSSSVSQTVQITNNIISLSSSSANGIYFLSPLSGGSKVEIINNIISVSSSSSNSACDIYFNNAIGTVEIVNNILSSYSSASSYNVYFATPVNQTLEISNNNISSCSSNSAYGIYFSAPSSGTLFGTENNFYWEGTTGTSTNNSNIVFSNSKEASNFSSVTSEWKDILNKEFVFVLYYAVDSLIPDQKDSIKIKLESFEYVNEQSIKIVTGFNCI